jgi:hypothetical protein
MTEVPDALVEDQIDVLNAIGVHEHHNGVSLEMLMGDPKMKGFTSGRLVEICNSLNDEGLVKAKWTNVDGHRNFRIWLLDPGRIKLQALEDYFKRKAKRKKKTVGQFIAAWHFSHKFGGILQYISENKLLSSLISGLTLLLVGAVILPRCSSQDVKPVANVSDIPRVIIVSVIDDQYKPLPYATIWAEDPKVSARTDVAGKAAISVPLNWSGPVHVRFPGMLFERYILYRDDFDIEQEGYRPITSDHESQPNQ